jgi:RNA polymerase sigma-70 factor (ECF subfamily)
MAATDQYQWMEPRVAHRKADAAQMAATFEALVGPWVNEMYRVAAAIVGETDAQEVTQDALVDAWRAFDGLRNQEKARQWLHAIVANRGRKHLRSARSRPRLAAVQLPEPAFGDSSEALAEQERLDHAFESLSADQRIAVVLHHVLDLSVPQIAATLSVPEGTVKSRLHAGLVRMRAALVRDDDA